MKVYLRERDKCFWISIRLLTEAIGRTTMAGWDPQAPNARGTE
jgi:hypothetical protein